MKQTLRKLHQDGFRMAVASSSHSAYVKKLLQQNNIQQYFCVVVSSSEVKHAKPHPEIFLLAQKKLGVSKKDCVVVEDAKAGVIAAKRANISCLCVLSSEKKEQVPISATIVPSHKKLYQAIIKQLNNKKQKR